MPDEATPHTPASADKVVERVQADRDKIETYIIKCRFRWPFLITACLIGTGAEVITDIISGVRPTTWYLGTLGGAGFYLFLFALIQAGLRANLRDSNQLLAGTDSNPQISTIPTPPRHRRKPFPERTWRDHPLFVATVAVAGTVYLMFTAVIPTWLKEKDNQIAELKTAPLKLRSELDDVRGQLTRMESENLKLRRDIDRLSPDSLFSLDDVYPKGFRSVRIGDRTDMVKEVYRSQAESIEDEGSWVSVKLKNPQLFTQITYYYDENARLKTVTFILFHLNTVDGRAFNLLKQQLIDKYSQAKMKETGKSKHFAQLEWSGINKHTVVLDPFGLHITRSD